MPLPLVPAIIAGVVAATQFNGIAAGIEDASKGQDMALMTGQSVNTEIGDEIKAKSPVKAFIDGMNLTYLPAIELTKALRTPKPPQM